MNLIDYNLDEKYGEEIHAAVVPKEGQTVTEKEIEEAKAVALADLKDLFTKRDYLLHAGWASGSDRAPGRKGNHAIEIPLTGPTVPASLRRIDVRISIAGRLFSAAWASSRAASR